LIDAAVGWLLDSFGRKPNESAVEYLRALAEVACGDEAAEAFDL
jgi:hypothetical protein